MREARPADRSYARQEGTILIVDDTGISGATLEIALSGLPGMQVVCVSSAAEALRNLNAEGSRILAVVTDIRMPAMDGFDLIQLIRSAPATCTIPIIVVTGDTDPETPERTSRLGANAFFAKPFSPGAVRKAMEKLLYGTDQN